MGELFEFNTGVNKIFLYIGKQDKLVNLSNWAMGQISLSSVILLFDALQNTY